eukprot:3548060-Prymnesium_polylepis.2
MRGSESERASGVPSWQMSAAARIKTVLLTRRFVLFCPARFATGQLYRALEVAALQPPRVVETHPARRDFARPEFIPRAHQRCRLTPRVP